MYLLRQLKKDMEFNRDLTQILEVFKNIAVSELRKLQTKRRKSDTFFGVLEGFFAAFDWNERSRCPFLRQDKALPRALVAITSDEGFSGGLNSMVLSKTLSLRTNEEDELIILGERGVRFLEGAGENFIYFSGLGKEIEYNQAVKLTNFLIEQYLKKRWGRVSFVYSHFVSVAQQEVRVFELLPCRLAVKDSRGDQRANLEQEIIIEPDKESVLDYLLKLWMISEVFEMLWESRLSEWAARIIHLEGSIHTLSEWHKNLRFRYLKCMHELKDINIREIFASSLNEQFTES